MPSIEVDRLPTRTVALHGITGPELNRLSGVVRFMELHRQPRRGLWWLHTNKGTTRTAIANIQKRITRLQRAYGLRLYNVTTFEGRSGLHAHIAFLGTREIAEHLKSSTAFGDFIQVDPSQIRTALRGSTWQRNVHRKPATAASMCSVAAFADRIASTAVATACASPAI
jgi:hypothetical protein